jgi:hypothetical protein
MKVLPLFPLQLVAFPNEQVNLHIFEPRYKKLIRDCEKGGLNFGIPPYIKGKVVDTGTELELLSIYNVKPDGSCDVQLIGKRVFQIVDFIFPENQDDYLKGSVESLEYYPFVEVSFQNILLVKLRQLFELLGINKDLPNKPDEMVSFDYGHYVGLNLEQELTLLRIPLENERIKFLIQHLDYFIPQVQEMNDLKNKILLNGHIKYLKPPLF